MKSKRKKGIEKMIARTAFYVLCVLAGLLLSACQPAISPDESVMPPTEYPTRPYPVDEGDEKFLYGQDATVESVDVILLESFPVQAQAKVTGYLPDGCTELYDVSVEHQDMNFILTLTTRRPSGDIACTEALVPFEEVVRLDIEGIEAGTYTVIAQNQEATFELAVDNVLLEQDKDVKFEYGSDAVLESMTLNIMESFPIQISATLSGYLPNGCIKIDQINILRDEQVFMVKIITKSPTGDVSCTMAIVPFKETVALDVEGLTAGEYIVQSDEISESFTLNQDNKIP